MRPSADAAAAADSAVADSRRGRRTIAEVGSVLGVAAAAGRGSAVPSSAVDAAAAAAA